MAKKFKIVCDGGHGGSNSTPGKRTPDNEYEWNFNNKVVLAFIEEMNKYENVEILRVDDPTGKTDVPLITRTNKANAWGADVYLSFHHNANSGKWGTWTGTETFTYLGSWPEAERLEKCVHPGFAKAYGLKDRGLKKKDLHVLRESKMPAVLLEGGFMDSTIDIKKLRDDKVLRNAGIAVAQGVAQYAKLKKKAAPAPKPQPKPTPAPTPSTPAPTGATYKIKKGDTFWGIANGLKGVTVEDLKKWNPKVNPTALQIGQVINVSAPKKAVKTHTIKKGDTLWGLSQTYKLSVAELQKLNPNVTPSALQIGAKLIVG